MTDDDPKPTDDTAAEETDGLPISRRTFMWLTGAGLAGVLTTRRFGCYPSDDFDGAVMARWEAHTMAAAAMVLIPDVPGEWPEKGPSAMEVAQNVDAYLRGMPRPMRREIRGLFGLIEHGTLLSRRIRRFSRLSAEKRHDVLTRLRDRGGMFALAIEGLRALCYVGWYQDDRTWEAIGYSGPLMERDAPPPVPTPTDAGPYATLVAEPGTPPRGVL